MTTDTWGLDFTGRWIEHCSLACMFLTGGAGAGRVHDTKIDNGGVTFAGGGHAIVLHKAQQMVISGCATIATGDVEGACAVLIQGGNSNIIADNMIMLRSATHAVYGVKMIPVASRYPSYNSVVNNIGAGTGASNVFLAIGAEWTRGNLIANNIHTSLGAFSDYAPTLGSYNMMAQNGTAGGAAMSNLWECSFTTKNNDTGGTISRSTVLQEVAGDPDNIEKAEAAGGVCYRFLGINPYAAYDRPDGTIAVVVTKGYVTALTDGSSTGWSTGDWLTNSAVIQGTLRKAVSGDLVLCEALANAANTSSTAVAVRVFGPGERFLMP